MRIFLTGGPGLLGSHVAEVLRARGDAVVCLHRTGSRTAPLERLGCELVRGDLLDPATALADLVAGCDAVVHAAALVYSGAGPEQTQAVNVGGTDRLAVAAAAAGVRHLVVVSSVAVYGGDALDDAQ